MKSTFTSVMACAAMAGLLAWSTPATPAPALDQGQFATEAEAKASCPAESVVWANLRSKVYHASSSKSYGKTKRGAYMCEKEATRVHHRGRRRARRLGAISFGRNGSRFVLKTRPAQ